MAEQVYQKGQTLFKTGDRSDTVFLIISGSVEILKSVNGKFESIGSVEPGQYTGGIAVLVDRNHTTTARAKSDGTRAQLLEMDEFIRMSSNAPEMAYDLLYRISERLHASKRRSTDFAVLRKVRDAQRDQDSAKLESAAQDGKIETNLTVFPQSTFLEPQMPKEGIIVMATTFIVGRRHDTKEQSPIAHSRLSPPGFDRRRQTDRRTDGGSDNSPGSPKVNLQLIDSPPYRLSRVHFLIQKMAGGRFIVRDLGSTLGTQVGNTNLGTDFANDFTSLEIGENIIIAGGQDSPYVFRVFIDHQS